RVEQPAVIAAADAALLDPPVVERGAAVAAVRSDEPGPPGAVAEQDEVLAERAHRFRRRAGVGGQPDRMPIAPQQLAHRRAAADLGQVAVVGRGPALVAAARADVLARHALPPLRFVGAY